MLVEMFNPNILDWYLNYKQNYVIGNIIFQKTRLDTLLIIDLSDQV